MEYTRMRLGVADHIAELTLTSPETMNVVDQTFHEEITDVFLRLGHDRDVRAVVLAAEGPVFSAGGDFEFILACNESLEHRLEMVDDAYRLIAAQLEVDPPIVVAMHGHALGVGASLVLASDAVVAHPACKLGDPHVALGLVAGDGGCLVWPQSAGILRAKRHLLTGEPLTADLAYQLGLVTDLVDTPEEVLPAARALAERIAALPPLAVRLTKRTLNRVLKQRFSEVMELSFSHELASLGSDDVREAISAFRERRPGKYVGH